MVAEMKWSEQGNFGYSRAEAKPNGTHRVLQLEQSRSSVMDTFIVWFVLTDKSVFCKNMSFSWCFHSLGRNLYSETVSEATAVTPTEKRR
ncbi:unnamed protein product [Microthlaspi erraticum]|uniref:Uncharacterized protein n=1 Tax=Microthlaspi erraticum TaxID=1685480 RepID=A0A6D2L1G1_9BRAS|nr:unnamed protein product [Microthlaspi erraticum]